MMSLSSSSIKNNPVASKGAAKSPLHFLYLVALCAIIVYSYDSLLDPYNGDGTTTGRRQMGTGSGKQPGKRAMAVVKSVWPECVENHLTAIQCKDFIDSEIMTLFSDEDRFIRTKIVGKRDEDDEWYNAIVIQMDDNDLTLGRNEDGKVYYDFEWDGSGEQATTAQETEIPPVIATETTSGAIEGSQVVTEYAEYTPDDNSYSYGWGTDDYSYGTTTTSPTEAAGGVASGTQATQDENIVSTAAPQTTVASPQVQGATTAPVVIVRTAVVYEAQPIVPEEQPLLVEGGTVDGTIAGTETNPINGGVILDGSASNTEEGEAAFNEAINTEPVIAEAGPRQITAFSCAGLTGFYCCLMIKHVMRDHDTHGKAIQCFLEYAEGTGKRNYMNEASGKSVVIHANHNGYVSLEPYIEGTWDGATASAEVTGTTVAPTTTQAEAGQTPQRDIDWLESHNTRRQLWHENNGATYVPMQWSTALEAEALVFAHNLADTDQFYHDPNRGPYGENLAKNSGSSGVSPTTDEVLSRWVEDEANKPYPSNGHLTQVLWRATTWVGCADASSSDGNTHIQVCRYARPGNCNVFDSANWLEPMLQDTSLCGAECHPDECSTSNVEDTPVVSETTAATTAGATTQVATQAAEAEGNRNTAWVTAHNTRRQLWHEDNSVSYVPLEWSAALAAEALVFAHKLADEGLFYHDSNRGPYGENLAMNSGSGVPSTADNVLSRWVEGEVEDAYPANGHLTQALWRATTWVGCADASNGNTHIQVCRYARPGNCNMANYGSWLEPMLLPTSLCGAECHPDECSTSNVDDTPVESETTAAATVPSATTQLATQEAEAEGDRDTAWVTSHNTRRQTWHEENSVSYVPLQWSASLAAESLVFAQHLAETNQFYHDPNNNYGENLAANSGSGGQRTTENVVGRWVEGEIGMAYPSNGHLTQALWRPSRWVGCADAQNGDRHVQVCRYAVPGNCNMNAYTTWLEPMLHDTSPCVPACHPDDC